MMTVTITAVVVTRNRLSLLGRCLTALDAQVRRPDRVLVIDNASDDGTEAWLAQQAADSHGWIEAHRLPRNTGGAGGFAHGSALAWRHGAHWIWLMDDDCIPTPSALAALVGAWESFPEQRRPSILASRVVWEDGRLHPMNLVAVKQRFGHEDLWEAAARSCLSIRSATFVSLMVCRDAIDRHGLPLPEYFLWNDDVEFTSRVLRHEFGIAVPASQVLHATAKPYGTHDAGPERYFFYVRNQLLMLFWSTSHDRMEKVYILQMLIFNCLRYLWMRRLHPAVWWCFLRAWTSALTRRPHPRNPRDWPKP